MIGEKENRNTYIVGTEERLRELFPMYNGGDERKLPNGKMIMEFRPELMGNIDELKADTTLEVFSHEEMIAELDKIIEETT